MTQAPPAGNDTSGRRRWLTAAGTAIGLGAAALPGGAQAAARARGTRARYRLTKDFAVARETFGTVPWDQTLFQTGGDVALQSDGKLLIKTSGLYQIVFSGDWDAKSGNDIDLRKLGVRRQAAGQGDTDEHDRLGFLNMPGSDPPVLGRYSGNWAPAFLPLNGLAHVDVTVTPAGSVGPGDSVTASMSTISRQTLDDQALTALMVQAKVIAQDTVRVSLYNPCIASGIQVPPGVLKVVAFNATRTRGSNGDAWMVLNCASVELNAGDRIYCVIEHKVDGTLLQATRSTFLQIDKLA